MTGPGEAIAFAISLFLGSGGGALLLMTGPGEANAFVSSLFPDPDRPKKKPGFSLQG